MPLSSHDRNHPLPETKCSLFKMSENDCVYSYVWVYLCGFICVGVSVLERQTEVDSRFNWDLKLTAVPMKGSCMWVCGSIPPGITSFPLASIVFVPPGIVRLVPTCLRSTEVAVNIRLHDHFYYIAWHFIEQFFSTRHSCQAWHSFLLDMKLEIRIFQNQQLASPLWTSHQKHTTALMHQWLAHSLHTWWCYLRRRHPRRRSSHRWQLVHPWSKGDSSARREMRYGYGYL